MMGRLSIRYKFLAVTTLLLMVCVGAYLVLATKVFKTDKTELVFDYNRSLVTNIASEMDSFFQGVSDKMKLIAFFSRRPESEKKALLKDLMLNNPDIVFVAESARFETLSQIHFRDSEYLETYALKPEFFETELAKNRPIPFEQILKEGQAIWNATTAEGAPLLGYGRSIVEETDAGVPLRQYAMVAYVRSDRLLRALQQSRLNEVFIANHSGEILAHLDRKVLLQPKSEKAFVESILASKLRTSVLQMEKQGENILGAFSKAFNDQILVVSQVSEDKAFAVVNRLLYRSVAFAMMVLTLAFIAAILFSRSLTKPLEVLMSGMRKVSQGDLNTHIEVQSRDELQVLAGSFNEMIEDLKVSRQELENINRDLEKKVKERTQQLEQQNQAVKNAQEALLRTTRLAAVGEIAGRAAHEVLNPLTGILSRLEIMKSRLQDNAEGSLEVVREILSAWENDVKSGGWDRLVTNWKQPSQIQESQNLFDEDLGNLKNFELQVEEGFKKLKTDTDFLLKEGLRINKIVQSMRGLSVVQSDRQPWTIGELLNEGSQIMADWVSQYATEIRLDLKDPQARVHVDKDEFLQALTNLLRNSTQAIQQKKEATAGFDYKGKIQISAEVKGEAVEIRIYDNGVGITSEHQSKLFEGQFTTKSHAEGTGLGLNISRRFIRAFGGDIQLTQSQPGQGTEFLVRLPLLKDDNERKSA